jgi:hypothetical protein
MYEKPISYGQFLLRIQGYHKNSMKIFLHDHASFMYAYNVQKLRQDKFARWGGWMDRQVGGWNIYPGHNICSNTVG